MSNIFIKFQDFLNENKNLPNIYKTLDYESPDYISVKTHSFLINWSWNSDFLHYYQSHGIDAIDGDIVNELSQWKPKESKKLYRAVCDKSEEIKYKNKLKSYFTTYDAAKDVLDDMNCQKTGGYIDIRTFTPDEILVDITMIPNYSDIDLIDEVICIFGSILKDG